MPRFISGPSVAGMGEQRDHDPAEEAARAARQAADEAVDPRARLFLRQHADRLARVAAAPRAADARRVAAIAPLIPLLPV